VVLVGALVLSGAGGAAIGLGLPDWLAGAIAAVLALVAATITERVFEAKADRGSALAARRRVLDPLKPAQPIPAETAKHRDSATAAKNPKTKARDSATAAKDPAAAAKARADVLALLRADRSPMPFRARTGELQQLIRWRSAQGASPVFLLSGPAGVGKTRLAIELGSRVPDGWAAGWLHAGMGATAIEAVAAAEEACVILADDADGRPDLVPLLDALAEHAGEPVIRVLLVTRSADGLRESLAARVSERHAEIVSGAPALELAPAGGADDQARWFDEAVRAFARHLEVTAPVAPGHISAGPAGHASRAPVREPFVMTLARALVAVLDRDAGDPAPRRLSFEQVAEELMRHERRRWDAAASAWDWGMGGAPSPAVRERAITALALLGADGEAEAAQALRRVPELEDASSERRHAIASWIASLYPSGITPRIRPDIIGEWFVVSQLNGNPALARNLQAGLTDDQASQALGLLARAADWLEPAAPLFGQFAGGDVRRQILAAVQATLTGDVGRNLLDEVLASQLGSSPGRWEIDQLTALSDRIPEHVLLRTRLMLGVLTVAEYRVLAAGDPDAHNPALARALDNLGAQLDALGRHHEALTAATEAITLYRALATTNPDAHNPALARALNSLGIWLNALGRHHEALTATTEAITLRRALATTNPDAHNPALANALNSLGVWLNALGRYHEALTATTEAITLYRALTTTNPGTHNPALARALDNLGVRLGRLGRYREALTATTEAITLYRALTTTNPGTHNPALASALNNLGIELDALGRHAEALVATSEAVTLYRALATTNPDAHNPALALALDNLGTKLNALGRYHEALQATSEAITLRRALATTNPGAHNPDLARALDNLGAKLDALGRYHEALQATSEAITLYRALATTNPDAHNPALANALGNLGTQLGRLRRHREALTATSEAVTLYRALTTTNPDAHNPDLASALNNLGIRLDQLERRGESREARAEAVRIYRDLAERDPDLYGAEYRRLDAALRREYSQLGLERQAVAPEVDPQAARTADPPVPAGAGPDGQPAGAVREEKP
jgi:tetratricopeptide (TPR) repeat protein